MRLLVQHPLYDYNTLVTVALFQPIQSFVRLFDSTLSCSDSNVLLMTLQAVLQVRMQPV